LPSSSKVREPKIGSLTSETVLSSTLPTIGPPPLDVPRLTNLGGVALSPEYFSG
jgi:hypothetical protein